MLLRRFHIPPGLARRYAIPAGQRAQNGRGRKPPQQAERSVHAFGVLGHSGAPPIVHAS
jgi:hypothetical protein